MISKCAALGPCLRPVVRCHLSPLYLSVNAQRLEDVRPGRAQVAVDPGNPEAVQEMSKRILSNLTLNPKNRHRLYRAELRHKSRLAAQVTGFLQANQRVIKPPPRSRSVALQPAAAVVNAASSQKVGKISFWLVCFWNASNEANVGVRQSIHKAGAARD